LTNSGAAGTAGTTQQPAIIAIFRERLNQIDATIGELEAADRISAELGRRSYVWPVSSNGT